MIYVKSVQTMLSSKSFIVSGLTVRSLIDFEFIFVYGIKKCSNFILKPLHMLSTRDPPQNRGHIQTESEGLEKDFLELRHLVLILLLMHWAPLSPCSVFVYITLPV